LRGAERGESAVIQLQALFDRTQGFSQMPAQALQNDEHMAHQVLLGLENLSEQPPESAIYLTA